MEKSDFDRNLDRIAKCVGIGAVALAATHYSLQWQIWGIHEEAIVRQTFATIYQIALGVGLALMVFFYFRAVRLFKEAAKLKTEAARDEDEATQLKDEAKKLRDDATKLRDEARKLRNFTQASPTEPTITNWPVDDALNLLITSNYAKEGLAGSALMLYQLKRWEPRRGQWSGNFFDQLPHPLCVDINDGLPYGESRMLVGRVYNSLSADH